MRKPAPNLPGDASGLYLRGQFTIHRNDHSINDLWRQCSNLGSGLEAQPLRRLCAAPQSARPTGPAGEGL